MIVSMGVVVSAAGPFHGKLRQGAPLKRLEVAPHSLALSLIHLQAHGLQPRQRPMPNPRHQHGIHGLMAKGLNRVAVPMLMMRVVVANHLGFTAGQIIHNEAGRRSKVHVWKAVQAFVFQSRDTDSHIVNTGHQ
jgi:hypothetical protein